MSEQAQARRGGALNSGVARLDALDAALINLLQGDLPLLSRPFARVADELGCGEDQVLARLQRLLDEGTLTRFGPLFQIERAGGCFVLAAMAVPPERFDEITARVNAHPQVAHNYRREHQLNMWFVLATEEAAEVARVIAAIEAETGLKVRAFPKEREYFVGLYLPAHAHEASAPGAGDTGPGNAGPLDTGALAAAAPPRAAAPRPGARSPAGATPVLGPLERRLMAATQQGLPLVARPFEALAQGLGLSETELLHGLQAMRARGLIRRIGALPNHYRLGYVANGMTVWDVADEQVDAIGARIGALPGVSHCYRRPRSLPDWPYNLFAMLHGHSRAAVQAQALEIRALLGPACRASDILYSSAILKKTGLRLASRPKDLEV